MLMISSWKKRRRRPEVHNKPEARNRSTDPSTSSGCSAVHGEPVEPSRRSLWFQCFIGLRLRLVLFDERDRMLFVQPTKCPHDDEIAFFGHEYFRNNVVHVF